MQQEELFIPRVAAQQSSTSAREHVNESRASPCPARKSCFSFFFLILAYSESSDTTTAWTIPDSTITCTGIRTPTAFEHIWKEHCCIRDTLEHSSIGHYRIRKKLQLECAIPGSTSGRIDKRSHAGRRFQWRSCKAHRWQCHCKVGGFDLSLLPASPILTDLPPARCSARFVHHQSRTTLPTMTTTETCAKASQRRSARFNPSIPASSHTSLSSSKVTGQTVHSMSG